jgi:phosphoribosylformylglycinamidine (FGAM) synthase-like enzyme
LRGDPFEGGKQAIAECWRNLSAVGAEPLAATDNLNFGNPEKPEIMGQLVGCLEGIGAACRALDFPIVSGNVSLYNETNGVGILPTPAIGGVGLLPDIDLMATVAFKTAGDVIVQIGRDGSHLGQSIYLREILGREEGAPPPVDLAEERRAGDFVRGVIRNRLVTACHDLSDGGLLVALAEMAMARGLGATVSIPASAATPHGFLFGEDQARYVVTVDPSVLDAVTAAAAEAGVEAKVLGTVGGEVLDVAGLATISVAKLKQGHENWFPEFMAVAD